MTDRLVWKFTPVAHAEDPRWLNREIAQTLFVEAPTPAEAIVAATSWDSRNLAGHVGNESAHDHSAFADEKLYRVDRAAPEEADKLDPASGPVWSGGEALVLDNETN